ncbi:hypothetical protein D3C83_31210 [compost metagenome]
MRSIASTVGWLVGTNGTSRLRWACSGAVAQAATSAALSTPRAMDRGWSTFFSRIGYGRRDLGCDVAVLRVVQYFTPAAGGCRDFDIDMATADAIVGHSTPNEFRPVASGIHKYYTKQLTIM